jgi:hypothetical protein
LEEEGESSKTDVEKHNKEGQGEVKSAEWAG